MAKAKPFIKWAGGKGQLLDQLDAYLPEEFGERRNITYYCCPVKLKTA